MRAMKSILSIPKLRGYNGVKNVITVQKPSSLSEVTMTEARDTMRALRNNETAYNTLRGQINAAADASGHRLNILFSDMNPGMLDITIAPKSAATSREFLDEIVLMFKDSKNMKTHFSEVKRMFKEAKNLQRNENYTTVTVDPSKNFIPELRATLTRLIENKEFRKRGV